MLRGERSCGAGWGDSVVESCVRSKCDMSI